MFGVKKREIQRLHLERWYEIFVAESSFPGLAATSWSAKILGVLKLGDNRQLGQLG
jgi:hypothetical protein